MIGNFNTDKKGNVVDEISQFSPTDEVKNFTHLIQQDYETGHLINHRVFREFNDMSLIQRMDEDQKAWNSYVQPVSDDPDETWRWNGVRPITRNKIISIAAHVTASVVYPNVFAQNDQDEEDKEAADVMRYMMEWNIRNSDYEMVFVTAVISALVNPIVYLKADYSEVLQTIKERTKTGELSKKEIEDNILSGFNAFTVPADEIMIANPYEFELQRQRFIIRRRFIDFDEAKGLYGIHKNFKYVSPGVKTIYNHDDGMFYQQKNEENKTLVEEVIYYNRREDTQSPFVNGIYMGDDNVSANSIKHRDNKNRPKYPYVKIIHEPIDEKRFFFGRSAAMKMADDQELYDRMWQMVMDGTFLQVMPPIAVMGGEKIDTNIIFPAGVSNFGRDTTITPIQTGNLQAGYNALDMLKQSLEESSQADIREGIAKKSGQTAFEIARLEQNAKIKLGIFGKMVGRAIKDFGDLMIDLIIHNQTVAEAEQMLGGNVRMKFRTFLLSDQPEGGKKVTRKIKFDEKLIGKMMTAKQKEKASFRIMEEEGGIDSDSRIYRVNPELFSRLQFKVFVEPDNLMPKNEAFEKALKLEIYDRAIANPYVEHEAITRDFLLDALIKGESDKYIKKSMEGVEIPPIEREGEGKTSSLISQSTSKNTLKRLMGVEAQ